MSERERLIKLIDDSKFEYDGKKAWYEQCADYLLENGVIVPPFKVGDRVYIVVKVTRKIIESTVIGAWICEGNYSIITDCGTIHRNSLNKTVFLTKEEAEQKLNGGTK